MLSTALKYINLIVLPHPPFSVPPSGFDPIHRPYSFRKQGDPGTTYNRFQNSSFAQSDSLAVLGAGETPAKKSASSAHQAGMFSVSIPGFAPATKQRIHSPENAISASTSPRRNAVVFPCLEVGGAANALPEVPRAMLAQSQHPESSLPPSPNGLSNMLETTPTKIMGLGGPKVRIIEPKEIAMQKRLWEDIAALYDGSPTRGEHSPSNYHLKKKATRRHSDESLSSPSHNFMEKRSSAPPVLTLSWESQGLHTLDENTLYDPSASPSRLHPTSYRRSHLQTSQRSGRQPLSVIDADSSYTSRLYELELSPIMEDAHVFTNPYFEDVSLQAVKKHIPINNIECCEGPLDSSGSSYGEVLQESTFDYFDPIADETVAWHNNVEIESDKRDLPIEQDQNQQEDRTHAEELYHGIPRVTLTTATPELKDDTLPPWMSKLVHAARHDQSSCHMDAPPQWDGADRLKDRPDRTTNRHPIVPTDAMLSGGQSYRRTSFVTGENYTGNNPYCEGRTSFIQPELMYPTAHTFLDTRALAFGPDLVDSYDGTCPRTSIDYAARGSRASDSAIQDTPEYANTRSFARMARSLLRPVSWFGQRNRNTFTRLEDSDSVALDKIRRHSWNLPRLSRVAKDIYPAKSVRPGGVAEAIEPAKEDKSHRRHSSFLPVFRSAARDDNTVDDPISQSNLPRANDSQKFKGQTAECSSRKKRRWTLFDSVKRSEVAL